MKRWEYQVVRMPAGVGMNAAVFNAHGQEGWEIVSMDTEQNGSVAANRGLILMKRPLPWWTIFFQKEEKLNASTI